MRQKIVIGVFVFLIASQAMAITKKTNDASIQIYSRTSDQGLTISQNGNLGVGTSNTQERLNVEGGAVIYGTVTANNYIGDGSTLTGLFTTAIADTLYVSQNHVGNVTINGVLAATANAALTANIALNSLKLNGQIASEMSVSTANIALTANVALDSLLLNGQTAAELTVGTSNIALTANEALKLNGQIASEMSVSTANIALTANEALKLNGQIASEMSVSTANIALTANEALKLNGQIASEMSVSTANIALTANYAVSADMLDGQHGAFYQDASNINAGTLGLARLNAAVVTNNYNSGVVINAVLTVNALQVNGSIATAIASGGNHLLTRSDSVWLGSGPSTVTLPSAAGIAGRQYTIKKTDSAATQLVIDAGAELIDGLNTTYVLTAQQEYVTLVSDGTGWVIAGSN